MPESPLYSTLQNDPEMAELIEFFLDELNHRVESLNKAWTSSDADNLRVIAHQLKGAAAGYGYQCITDAARELESGLDQREADLSSLTEEIESLILLCKKAAAARQ